MRSRSATRENRPVPVRSHRGQGGLRRSATPTASVMLSAMVADMGRNPSKSSSTTSNHMLAEGRSGLNGLSVMTTSGAPRAARRRDRSSVAEA